MFGLVPYVHRKRQASSLSLYLYILFDWSSHTVFVFTSRKISCHRFQQFTVCIHTFTNTSHALALSQFTHRYFQFIWFNWMKWNWNRQRVFFYTCRCTCRCVNIWFEHALFQREILSYSTIRSAQWQRDDAKFTLCLHRSMCRSSERESFAIHWKSHRCECLCNDVITWCIVIATPYNRHDQHACRVYKQNGNNRLAFIRHCLLRTQNAESREYPWTATTTTTTTKTIAAEQRMIARIATRMQCRRLADRTFIIFVGKQKECAIPVRA